ncbi:MAG: universal stress protein [Candidatus Tectomicrobia bacterium]|uniref:Universal stress protein n=1 Tax=Tectimicrobiota bacterium TaxID=2528274 RepID=A0A937W367_UNCTE|nr:universal stress protein [Candidatus Tectomicrobia bacterium]
MLRSVLVGLDGSPYSTAAVELGVQWAQRAQALFVGLGIIDEPTICAPEAVSLGGTAYKVRRDANLVAEARMQVQGFLAHCAERCTAAAVASLLHEETGLPADCILAQAQYCDVILLGQQTHFHFATQDGADETLRTVLKSCPRPVVAVPTTVREGHAVVIAYDGSLQAARTLQMLPAIAPYDLQEVHVVSIHAQQAAAVHCAERAVEFLRRHHITAQPYAMATTAAPAAVLLEHIEHVQASLLVMGAYGQPVLREFFFGSVTRTLLEESPVPLFLYH